jgi:hypothetical protein
MELAQTALAFRAAANRNSQTPVFLLSARAKATGFEGPRIFFRLVLGQCSLGRIRADESLQARDPLGQWRMSRFPLLLAHVAPVLSVRESRCFLFGLRFALIVGFASLRVDPRKFAD